MEKRELGEDAGFTDPEKDDVVNRLDKADGTGKVAKVG